MRFRAWNKKNKYMCEVDGINLEGDLLISNEGLFEIRDMGYSSPFPQNICVSNDYEIMLSTGLLDVNGTEIFEGDIVKSIWKDLNGVVKYGVFHGMYKDTYTDLQLGFYVEDENGDTGSLFGHGEKLWFTVIGNKHNDPELLWNR